MSAAREKLPGMKRACSGAVYTDCGTHRCSEA